MHDFGAGVLESRPRRTGWVPVASRQLPVATRLRQGSGEASPKRADTFERAGAGTAAAGPVH